MVYAKASSQQYGLIEELPELSELDNIIENKNDKKFDKFIRDKYTPPSVSGMSNDHNLNNMSILNNPGQEFIYNNSENYLSNNPQHDIINNNSQNYADENFPELMENETKLNIENLTEDIVVHQPKNILHETKNYSEPPPQQVPMNFTPWPQPYPYNQHYGYYNNPYNHTNSFPITSNYQQYTQYPPFPQQQYPNIVNGYNVPVEGFDNTMPLPQGSVPIPSSLQNRKGELNTRKLGRDFKKFQKKQSKKDKEGSPWQAKWDAINSHNECVGIANHIHSCPVCSKMYKNNNNQVIYIIIIVVLLIVCLILLQKILIV